jgi:hypothetical protein
MDNPDRDATTYPTLRLVDFSVHWEVPMDTEQQLHNLFTPALAFIMARRKESGGFSATPRLPATIQDTYHALNIINLSRRFDRTTGDESSILATGNVRTYLAVCLRFLSSIGINTTFQLLWACKSTGVEFDHAAVETAVHAKMQNAESLAEWYYCARILSEILKKNHLVTAAGQDITAVLDRTWRCVEEAWMHIYLARVIGRELSLPESELVAWFQACQNGDGGFGFFPGTTSFIENCHACLRSLALLGSQPMDLDRAALFLTGCQTAAGGFSRGGRAAPFLDATWHGLASLSLLSSIPLDHGGAVHSEKIFGGSPIRRSTMV